MPAVVILVSLMLVGLGAAGPTWRYIMKNSNEEELIFRGGQIADAIQRYQRKTGNALPVSLEMLVEGRYLRRVYEDPMTEAGKWRLIRQGELIGVIRPPGSTAAGSGNAVGPAATPTPRPSSGPGGEGSGPIVGVASRSQEQSLRVFNGRTRYDEWLFVAGQPRVVGRPLVPVALQPGQTPGTGQAAPAQPLRQPVQP
jgi:hypothetical protein